MDIIEIPTHMIDEDTDQPRYQFDEESLQELMKSIEELGLLSPIKVRTTKDGRYKIIYGNRRYKACKTLAKPTIPCIVSNVTDELEIYLEQIAENLTREGFSPIEEAEAFHKLLNDPKFSSSTKYLSSKLGKPEAYIKNKCDLLKFSNAVKKLVVSGTEIKKDKLTEEQLMPIKELPLEHRDPLALTIARDELSVSDVKRIAKLFKDKEISDSTKNKLLYKSGRELVETWSVFEQNRAERAKAAEPKAPSPVKSEKPGKNENESIPLKVTPLENALQKLSAALPVYNPFSLEILNAITGMEAEAKASFLMDINKLVDHLEKHLAEWKNVRGLTASKNINKQQDCYIFAGSYSEAEQEGIQLLSFNPEEGALKRLGGIAGVENPAFLTLDPERSRLFAVSEVEEGQVIAYSFDLQRGEIKEVNRQSTQGASPCHLTVDPTGRWLFTVNYSSGSVCLFPIAEDGSIGPIADFKQHSGSSISLDRQQEPHPHSIFSYPHSPYLLVPDLGTDEIYIYSHDASEGKLHLLATAPATAGSGPRHLEFHPIKPYVYVIQELDSTIAFYTIDEPTNSLTLQQTVSTLPLDYSGESYCADIHLSASGLYVYGSNRGDDSIAAFKIAEDGTLEWVGHSSTKGEIPRNFAVLPNGTHMLAANQESNSIIVMSLGADGIPIPTGERYDMTKPVCLKVLHPSF